MAQSWDSLTAAGHLGHLLLPARRRSSAARDATPAPSTSTRSDCACTRRSPASGPSRSASGLTPAAVAAAVGARKLQHASSTSARDSPGPARGDLARDRSRSPRPHRPCARYARSWSRCAIWWRDPSPTGPSAGHADGATAEEHTTRVADPPGLAYSERPKQDWVVRKKSFRVRRRGERAAPRRGRPRGRRTARGRGALPRPRGRAPVPRRRAETSPGPARPGRTRWTSSTTPGCLPAAIRWDARPAMRTATPPASVPGRDDSERLLDGPHRGPGQRLQALRRRPRGARCRRRLPSTRAGSATTCPS